MFMHKHEDFSEMVIVLEGSATHVINNESIPVSKGDVFIVGENLAHGYDDAVNFRIYNIMFRCENVFKHSYDLNMISGFNEMFINTDFSDTFTKSIHLTNQDLDNVVSHTKNILSEFNNRIDGWYAMMLSEFLMLTGIVSRINMKINTNIDMKKNLSDAVKYIENHYNEIITLDKLTEVSHYSLRQLNRLFNDYYDTSPAEYIITIRLREACKLLRNSNMSVSEIAVKCGFSSHYIGRVFKQRLGVTPKEYRINENHKHLNNMDDSCDEWITNDKKINISEF